MKTIELINILLEQRDCKRYQNLDDLFELLRIYEPEDMVHARVFDSLFIANSF